MTSTENTMLAVRRDELISRAYSAMYASVCGYVAKRIGRVADVEDVVQDIFESLLQPGRLLSEETLKKYIYSIAHNHVIDWYRRHACGIRAQEYFFAHSPLVTEGTEIKASIADIERLERRVLDQVRSEAKIIYMMYVHEGRSAKDIARVTGMKERAVENHAFRTREKVRKILKKAL